MTRRKSEKLPDTRVEIRLAGSGGQGVILAGLILAEAIGVHDGREVAMVQSYGPEARGGASKAEIIVSEEPIDYPLCTDVDLLVALNQEAADACSWDLKPGGWILTDIDLVTHPPSSRAIGLPFSNAAKSKLQRQMAANIVALGAISEITRLVSRQALDKALLKLVPPGSETLNKKALSLGIKLARNSNKQGTNESFPEPHEEDM